MKASVVSSPNSYRSRRLNYYLHKESRPNQTIRQPRSNPTRPGINAGAKKYPLLQQADTEMTGEPESIPNARFVALEGDNHILLEDEPAWPRFVEEVRNFLDSRQ